MEVDGPVVGEAAAINGSNRERGDIVGRSAISSPVSGRGVLG